MRFTCVYLEYRKQRFVGFSRTYRFQERSLFHQSCLEDEVIKHHNETKWSVIARNAMWEYARKIQLVDSVLEKSKFTDKDAAEIGKLIKKSIREQHDIE